MEVHLDERMKALSLLNERREALLNEGRRVSVHKSYEEKGAITANEMLGAIISINRHFNECTLRL